MSAYIHRVRYVARSSHVSNVATTPTSAQMITKGSENHIRNWEIDKEHDTIGRTNTSLEEIKERKGSDFKDPENPPQTSVPL